MSGITPQRSRAGQIFTPAREYNPLASRNFGSTNIRTGTPTRTVQQQPQQQVVRQAAPVQIAPTQSYRTQNVRTATPTRSYNYSGAQQVRAVRTGTPTRSYNYSGAQQVRAVRTGTPTRSYNYSGAQQGRVIRTNNIRTSNVRYMEPTTSRRVVTSRAPVIQRSRSPVIQRSRSPVVQRSRSPGRIISTTRGEPRVVAVNRLAKEPVVREVNVSERIVSENIIVPDLPAPPVQRVTASPPPKRVEKPKRSPPPRTNKSLLTIDDEKRYRTVHNQMHGYGRNNIKSRSGNSNLTYNKRNDLRVQDYIVSEKENTDKYRNDPSCNLI